MKVIMTWHVDNSSFVKKVYEKSTYKPWTNMVIRDGDLCTKPLMLEQRTLDRIKQFSNGLADFEVVRVKEDDGFEDALVPEDKLPDTLIDKIKGLFGVRV